MSLYNMNANAKSQVYLQYLVLVQPDMVVLQVASADVANDLDVHNLHQIHHWV